MGQTVFEICHDKDSQKKSELTNIYVQKRMTRHVTLDVPTGSKSFFIYYFMY